MTQRKQPKATFTVFNPSYAIDFKYRDDMFRNEHPCKLTEKQWVNQMDMAYPELNWTKLARK